MLPERVSNYLMKAVETAPELLLFVTHGLTDEDVDRRPDPDRFTIREALAHLADWEEVFCGRILQTRDEDNPVLQGYDEGQWAIDHDYVHSDWRRNIELFTERRKQLGQVLRSFTPAQWERIGAHTELGPISMEGQVVLISAHDHYHLEQIVAWRQSAE